MDFTHNAKKHRTLPLEPHGRRDAMDFENQIHYLETEAYSSILKAFIAQFDLLTWGKEGLMTELRRELNVTDVEHREILMKINSDESIKWIREQRKLASHAQDYVKINNLGGPFASMGNSKVRLKTPSSAAFYALKNVSRSQVSLTSIPIPPPMPVEKILFSREKPNLVEIKRAKLTLREQERAILEALDKLADVLDMDDPSNQMRPYEVPKDTLGGQERMMHGNYWGLVGRMNGLRDSFRYMPSG